MRETKLWQKELDTVSAKVHVENIIGVIRKIGIIGKKRNVHRIGKAGNLIRKIEIIGICRILDMYDYYIG